MHKLMAGVTILEHELSELRLLVERQTGILLDCPNSALAAHVADYLERNELDSPAALLGRLRSVDLDPSESTSFLDGVLNVNTGFFRHPGAMNALTRQIIPQIYSPGNRATERQRCASGARVVAPAKNPTQSPWPFARRFPIAMEMALQARRTEAEQRT